MTEAVEEVTVEGDASFNAMRVALEAATNHKVSPFRLYFEPLGQ